MLPMVGASVRAPSDWARELDPSEQCSISVTERTIKLLDGLGDGEVVVINALVLQLVLDAVPDGVAGLFGEVEEAAGLIGDGFEVADEGGAVRVVPEEGLETRVGADVAVAVGEEVGEISFEVCRGHGVEVG